MTEISIETWGEILQYVKERSGVPDVSFRTWLQTLKVRSVKNGAVEIMVTTGIMGVEYTSKKYLQPLKDAITEITGIEHEIRFILPEDGEAESL